VRVRSRACSVPRLPSGDGEQNDIRTFFFIRSLIRGHKLRCAPDDDAFSLCAEVAAERGHFAVKSAKLAVLPM
jgi:hypothetical protein